MISVLILVFSAALLFFYLQAACERIFQRPFEEPLARPIIEANNLTFPDIRLALAACNSPVTSARSQAQLKRDFVALTCLLRNAGTGRRSLSGPERTGVVYFRLLSGLLTVCCLLGMKGRSLQLKMTTVLEFFANVLGERTRRVCFAQLKPSEHPSAV